MSDLHAYTPSDLDKELKPPSFLRASDSTDPDQPNPLELIADTVISEGLAVDWIVCPGDIADKADPSAQAYVWSKFTALKNKMKARLLLSTAGNHDVDSRLQYSDFDPKGHLQSLTPPFPGLGMEIADRYWARNFHMYEEENALIINLNSAAFHGYHSDVRKEIPEYYHGRVTTSTISAIRQAVENNVKPLNILLTHHHIYKNQNIYAKDYSDMEMGSKLISELCNETKRSWLVIHGHQHYPDLYYGPGDAYVPVIFSAGSLSVNLPSDLARRAANQFYHISLETDSAMLNDLGPCGVVRAWHWSGRNHWERSPRAYTIPDNCGFGYTPIFSELAKDIREKIKLSGSPFMELVDLHNLLPRLKYLSKLSFSALVSELSRINVKTVLAENPIQSVFRIEGDRA